MRIQLAHEADFQAILALQELNLVSNLPESARGDGFVTTPLTLAKMRELVENRGLFVAPDKDNGGVAGYVVLASWQALQELPLFAHIIARFPLTWHNYHLTARNSWQYGPVCVAQQWRGHGVLQLLFAACCQELKAREMLGVTFINAQNNRSLRAHRDKLGMEIVDEFEFNDNRYFTLVFEA